MRLEPIPPAALSDQQRTLYDESRAFIEGSKGFHAFRTSREDGALIGPFNPWLHTPRAGRAMLRLTEALSSETTLPPLCQQVATLVTGTHFRAEYEVYAHVAVARGAGLAEAKITAIVAGQRPANLTPDEAAAHDAAAALVAGGPMPRALYDQAATAFGAEGVAELIYLVGLYALVSMTLNGFSEAAPE